MREGGGHDATVVENTKYTRVAVVGSGLAGQTVAYLLQNDPQNRYAVEVFERGATASLAATSIRAAVQANESSAAVDVPMRAITSGYYQYLLKMLDYLQIVYHEQRFRFVFAKQRSADPEDDTKYLEYFVQMSDAKGFPANKPAKSSTLSYCLDFTYVILCVCWLTVTFSIISTPRDDESFEEYLKRWRAPRRFVDEYLLPLLSAIATCSHEDLLKFPASDIVWYRVGVQSQRQYLVTGGIKTVQNRLMAGLKFHTRANVSTVKYKGTGVEISIETTDSDGNKCITLRVFDRVILAVSPNIAAQLFLPAQSQLAQIPFRTVDIVVTSADKIAPPATNCHDVILSTSFRPEGWTEATHVHESGLAVTSCWRKKTVASKCLAKLQITRTLRTPESREIVRRIFNTMKQPTLLHQCNQTWSNGEGNVWMVGAWCWDGMVLLEGAVVSAMQVAKAFGVAVPWDNCE